MHKYKTHFNKKKNSIVNCIVIKNYIKAHKDTKNIMRKSLNKKRKCVFTQWKRNYIINSIINTELIVKSINSQKNMLNEKSVNV